MLHAFELTTIEICDVGLPVIPTSQDCIDYDQKLSEVSAIIIMPEGLYPTNWQDISSWAGLIDNSDQNKGKYVVGIGSFLPNEPARVSLAGGRAQAIKERQYNLSFRVLNMADGHKKIARKIELGWKDFNIWLETIDGTIIGGQRGLRPKIANASYPFGEGSSREVLLFSMDFFFLAFPDFSFIGTLNPSPEGPTFWGDPGQGEIWGDPNAGEGWGWN